MKNSVFLLMLMSSMVMAKPDISVSGFGTIGVVTTDSDELGYRADFSKPGGVFDGDIDFAETSNLGVQFDIIANSKIDFVVQAVFRDQKEFNLDTAVNLAFMRYSPNANWSFRLGRTAYDLFLLTEYRDIGFAYTWAHVPSEIYGVVPHRHFDGADVTYSQPIGNLTFSSKLFVGKSKAGVSAFSSPNVTDFKIDNIVGIALDLQSINWDLALNHTELKFDSQIVQPLIEGVTQMQALVPGFSFIWPNALELANALDLDNRKGSYTSVSGQYRFDNVTVISELAKIDSDSLTVQPVKSGYISGVYHYNAHNFFASYAFSDSRGYDLTADNINFAVLAQIPDGLEAYAGAQFLANYYSLNQSTLSVGWRWDFDVNMSFKLQLDRSKIDESGSTFWQPPQVRDYSNSQLGHVNALFANVSFLF
ncbi:hypothetical protein [Paraglaciecola aestuariivivens]